MDAGHRRPSIQGEILGFPQPAWAVVLIGQRSCEVGKDASHQSIENSRIARRPIRPNRREARFSAANCQPYFRPRAALAFAMRPGSSTTLPLAACHPPLILPRASHGASRILASRRNRLTLAVVPSVKAYSLSSTRATQIGVRTSLPSRFKVIRFTYRSRPRVSVASRAMISVRENQRPRNLAGRFSRNALIPSRPSSLFANSAIDRDSSSI
jgi:hypothetical protein